MRKIITRTVTSNRRTIIYREVGSILTNNFVSKNTIRDTPEMETKKKRKRKNGKKYKGIKSN